MNKICTKCGKVKDVSQFFFNQQNQKMDIKLFMKQQNINLIVILMNKK